MHDLRGKVALVTGGSRGIGRAIALALANAGAQVAIGYRSGLEEAEAVALEVAAICGRSTALPPICPTQTPPQV